MKQPATSLEWLSKINEKIKAGEYHGGQNLRRRGYYRSGGKVIRVGEKRAGQ